MSSGYYRLGANVPDKVIPMTGVLDIAQPKLVMQTTHRVERKPQVDVSLTMLEAPDPRLLGYTGNTCAYCNSTRMTVSGHCEKCEDCGETTGCS